jgi:hypothetical protein
LTPELVKWVREGQGKLTPAQVMAKLGRPDRYEHTDFTTGYFATGDVQMVWEDRGTLAVHYTGGKLTKVSASYVGVPPMPELVVETVLKLRAGMTIAEASRILGERTRGFGCTHPLRLGVKGNKYAVHDYPIFYTAPPKPAPAPIPELPNLTRKLAEDFKKRKEKVGDLLKQLGRPDHLHFPHDGSRGPKGSTVLTWEDKTEVEAAYERGRTRRLVGWFSPLVPDAKVTLEAFIKLNHDTVLNGRPWWAVQEALGLPVEESRSVYGRGFGNVPAFPLVIRRYGKRRVLEVFVDAGGKMAEACLDARPKE